MARTPAPERRYVNLHMTLEMHRALEQYIVLTNSNKSHTMLTAIAKKIGFIGDTGTSSKPAANPIGNPSTLSQNSGKDRG